MVKYTMFESTILKKKKEYHARRHYRAKCITNTTNKERLGNTSIPNKLKNTFPHYKNETTDTLVIGRISKNNFRDKPVERKIKSLIIAITNPIINSSKY